VENDDYRSGDAQSVGRSAFRTDGGRLADVLLTRGAESQWVRALDGTWH
jgi:hypothetical protein